LFMNSTQAPNRFCGASQNLNDMRSVENILKPESQHPMSLIFATKITPSEQDFVLGRTLKGSSVSTLPSCCRFVLGRTVKGLV
jgi:hypothetical protein